MKKFFTLTPDSGLKPVHYTCKENTNLNGVEQKISFPILAAVAGYVKPGEDYEMIALGGNSNNYICEGYNRLQDELNELADNYGIKRQNIKEFVLQDEDTTKNHLEAFQRLIDLVEDNDEIFICVSFGSKGDSMVLTSMANSVYQAGHNISIGCIIEGHPIYNSERGIIRDRTPMFQMDQIVNLMCSHGRDPKSAINVLMNM